VTKMVSAVVPGPLRIYRVKAQPDLAAMLAAVAHGYLSFVGKDSNVTTVPLAAADAKIASRWRLTSLGQGSRNGW
jgi:hypothetical protein